MRKHHGVAEQHKHQTAEDRRAYGRLKNELVQRHEQAGAGMIGCRRKPINQAWTAESTYHYLGAHNVYYVKLNYWIRTRAIPEHLLSSPAALSLRHLSFCQTCCHSIWLNHQSACLDETASANLPWLSEAKSTNALCNARRGPARHAENFYTSAIRRYH